jgi:hypothetical protein
MMTSDSKVSPTVEQLIFARRDAFAAARDLYLTVVLNSLSIGPLDGERTYNRDRSVFVQYLNPEILACYGLEINGAHAGIIQLNAIRATRLAVLATDHHLIIPLSYMFEIAWINNFIRSIEPLVINGLVQYASSVPDLSDYRDIKVNEYRRDSLNPYSNFNPRRIVAHDHLIWAPRPGRSTAVDIGERWRKALSPKGDLHTLVRSTAIRQRRTQARVERILVKTPERLEGQAFIKRFVQQILPTEITAIDSSTLAFLLSKRISGELCCRLQCHGAC